MSDAVHESVRTDQLIEALTRDLRPVRRLRAPWLRAAAWLAVVAAAAVALASVADLHMVALRLAAALDMRLAVIGSVLTTILAAISAFELSMPDRSRFWALLPLPAAALWLGASGFGCLRSWLLPGTHIGTMSETAHDCLVFIVGMSLPLSALLLVMLRRARPLRPGLVAAMGGLAAAAAAASLLWFNHPYDTAATDLVVHIIAVLIVIGACRFAGGRALAG
jgi:hypothetical protein